MGRPIALPSCLSREEFTRTVLKVRVEKGMPNFDASKMANDNIAALCAYLKGRSDAAIQPGRSRS